MREYKDLREYIYNIRIYILVVMIVFVFSVVYGAMFVKTAEGKDMAKDIVKNMPKAKSGEMMMAAIFESNIYNSALAVFGGVLLGIIPLYLAVVNGIAIGGLILYFGQVHRGVLMFISVLGIHGVLEFILMFISMGIGLRLGYVMLMTIFNKSFNIRLILEEFVCGVKVYVKWIVPLILMSAFIEVYVSPLVARELMRMMIE